MLAAKIIIGIAALLVILAGIIAIQPSDFKVTRQATMNATPDVVFEEINDVKKSMVWSPWLKMEPDAKVTLEGPPAGNGAIMKWEGKQIGSGVMTITDSRPGKMVQTRLDFLKPFKATNTGEFMLQPKGNQTIVIWSMYGKNTFMGKAMSLIMNCDKIIGEQFDQGLANLKEIVENKKANAA